MSNFKDVGDFHQKFGLPVFTDKATPQHVPDEVQDFRLKFLREELHELEDGYETGDLAKVADALVDLVYVALGTAHYHNLPWDDLWNEVQRANMTKQRAAHANDSRRGSALDVIKPPNWQPPNIDGVLKKYGY